MEFRLVTGHKALEKLKGNAEFGKSSFSRLFARSNKSRSKAKDEKGEELIDCDALSRSVEGEKNVKP